MSLATGIPKVLLKEYIPNESYRALSNVSAKLSYVPLAVVDEVFGSFNIAFWFTP